MTSTTALETHKGEHAQRDDKLHRGRNVVLAFLMQGELVLYLFCKSRSYSADPIQDGVSSSTKVF